MCGYKHAHEGTVNFSLGNFVGHRHADLLPCLDHLIPKLALLLYELHLPSEK